MTEPALKTVRVIARLNVGGPARHVVLLDSGLRQRGYQTLLVHGSTEEGEASLEHLAADAAIPTFKIRELGRRINPLGDIRAFVRLVALLFKEHPDLVHTHTAKAGALGRLAAFVYNRTHRRRCAVIHTFHGHVLSGYFDARRSALVRRAERALAKVTDRVIAISPAQRDDLTATFKVASSSQTVVIPLGLELEQFLRIGAGSGDLRRELGIGASDVVIGYVGRLVPVKNLPMLLRAFASALHGHAGLWLLVAGDGPLRAELERLVDQAQIRSRVRFLGWTENLPAVYATLDVCVVTSLNEGTPVALIEAMASGKAVVATSVGGVRDLVEDGRTGLLVESEDTDGFARALVRMAQRDSERHQLGQEARRSVAVRYDVSRLVDDIETLYVQALSKRRGAGPCTTI